jgi:type III pantothenate kinase
VARPTLTVLDVGNTALKVVVFDGAGRVADCVRWGFSGDPAAAPVRATLRGLPRPVVAVSVSPVHLEAVRAAIGARLPVVGRDFPIPLENRTARPRETGSDRLCAALAARRRARGPAAAVGLGTAVTADAVDAGGAFLGGAIAPGLRSAAAGLSATAPRLPLPDLDPGEAPYPGGTSGEALRAGLLLGFAGLVDRLAAEAVRAASAGGRRRARVFLHGGDAPAVAPFLRTKAVDAPHLVAEGARLAWLDARRA